MGRTDLKLLGTKESMFAHRIIWALKLKGIEYEFVEEDLSNKSPLLLELNPVHKKVPVLVHGEKPISESLVILEYLDDTWKQHPILPQDPLDRAYARFWAKFVDEKFYQAAILAFFTMGEGKVEAVQSIEVALHLIEVEITNKKFFGGEEVGFLDIVVGWIAYWFKFVEEVGDFKVITSAKYPSMCSWINNFLQVPVIKDNLPNPDDLRGVFLGFKKMALANAQQ